MLSLAPCLLVVAAIHVSASPPQQRPLANETPAVTYTDFFPYCQDSPASLVFGNDIRIYSSATAFCSSLIRATTTLSTTATQTITLPTPAPTLDAAFPHITAPPAQAPDDLLRRRPNIHPYQDGQDIPCPALAAHVPVQEQSSACSCLIGAPTRTVLEVTTQTVFVKAAAEIERKKAEEEMRIYRESRQEKWPFGKGAERVSWDSWHLGANARLDY